MGILRLAGKIVFDRCVWLAFRADNFQIAIKML